MGTSSAVRGAVNDATCKPCRPGTFADTSGSDACEDCPKGHSSVLGSESCFACPEGTYASNAGEDDCNPCPHLTDSSGLGSSYCGVCKAGYYLQNSSVSPSDVFAAPTHHCKDCPPHADCSLPSTTLETLGVPARLLARLAPHRPTIHACDALRPLQRLGRRVVATTAVPRRSVRTAPARAATSGHTGPLCEWCVSDAQYFSRATSEAAPTARAMAERFGILAGTFAAAAGTGLLLYRAFTRTSGVRPLVGSSLSPTGSALVVSLCRRPAQVQDPGQLLPGRRDARPRLRRPLARGLYALDRLHRRDQLRPARPHLPGRVHRLDG